MEMGTLLGGKLADETLFRQGIEVLSEGRRVGPLGAIKAPGKEGADASSAFQSGSDSPYGAGDQRAVEPQPNQAVECVAGVDLPGAWKHCGENPGDGGGPMRQLGGG